MGTLILRNWFQNKLLKLTFSPVHVRSQKWSGISSDSQMKKIQADVNEHPPVPFFHSKGSSAGWRCRLLGSSPPPAGETHRPVKAREGICWPALCKRFIAVKSCRVCIKARVQQSVLCQFYFSNKSGNLLLLLLPRETAKWSFVAVGNSMN